jgi:hypothetical protein
MKQSIAKQWVAALRSGKYKQGKRRLKDGDNFCCLGVLCDISKLGAWSKRDWYGYADTFLPYSVMKWSGVMDAMGELEHQDELAVQNDNGKTFPEIADIIEREWEKL